MAGKCSFLNQILSLRMTMLRASKIANLKKMKVNILMKNYLRHLEIKKKSNPEIRPESPKFQLKSKIQQKSIIFLAFFPGHKLVCRIT